VSTLMSNESYRTTFDATVREQGAVAGADLGIELRGDIDGRAEAALQKAYAQAALRDPRRLLLDFAGVDYINSTGIALIVGLLARARKERREIVARGLSPHYREIFEITRLADFMTIVPDDGAECTPMDAAG
jgi:anti-sigma B factor antagonist